MTRGDADSSRARVGPVAPVLELHGVRAGYGQIEVLHGVDLSVAAGEVLALFGPNGAGKTTTLGVCSGQIRPSAGSVRLMGTMVNGARPHALARAGVCLIPEGRGIFPNLTVRENLRMATYSGVAYARVEERAFEQFPRLAERRTQLAGTLSGGEQQMLAISRGLATDPALLLLDELSMGLAPMIVAELYERVGEMAAAGLSILIVEQFAQSVLGVADRAAVMLGGRVQQVGEPESIAAALGGAYLDGH
ncbi:MAG: ABC transporter ATP-binding protein [Acidimicrobiia bacterium]|nr:ABC transporter ATP-binding protein [Acidimicrobiia bacterium]